MQFNIGQKVICINNSPLAPNRKNIPPLKLYPEY